MRGLIRSAFFGGVFLAGTGVLGLHYWPIADAEPTSFPPGDALRGAYLARAAGCVSCHTNVERDGLALAGGAPLDTPFGSFTPPNITPHLSAGIGAWTIKEFATAVRQGVSPDGKPYYPVFTYAFYQDFTDQEIADLWAGLQTVPAVEKPADDHDVGLPFSFRGGLKIWRAAFDGSIAMRPVIGASEIWNRGRQLVVGPAHCAACHSGRNFAGGLKPSEKFTGNDDLPGGNKAPPITAGELAAKGWTPDNLAFALKVGLVPSGDAFGGSMAEVVNYGTAYLTDADRLAIATYVLEPTDTGEAVVARPEEPTVDHSNMDMSQSN